MYWIENITSKSIVDGISANLLELWLLNPCLSACSTPQCISFLIDSTALCQGIELVYSTHSGTPSNGLFIVPQIVRNILGEEYLDDLIWIASDSVFLEVSQKVHDVAT